jgi:hypothetical protein
MAELRSIAKMFEDNPAIPLRTYGLEIVKPGEFVSSPQLISASAEPSEETEHAP